MPTKKSEMRCSFCGKLYTDVTKLIAGPGVYICDGCVNLCLDVLAEATAVAPPTLPEWASISDDELLELARKGTLKDPAVLNSQVDRMLADPRAQRFSQHFVEQWLGGEFFRQCAGGHLAL